MLLAENIMQEICRADWTSHKHNIGVFYSIFNIGDCLFQPVACKKAEVERPERELKICLKF